MSSTVGPIVFDLIGTELSTEEKELLQHPLIGGVIFFARNYESPEQITQLCRNIREARKKPILITVDQEGGRVQRFKTGFTRLPPMGVLGKLYDENPEVALRFATTCGWLMAAEVLAVGVDLSFAPVLDIDNKNNPVVGDRAFHQQTATIVKLARALTKGMREAGMAAVGKHFPGHGFVSVDSHLDLPVDPRSFDEIQKLDMQVFADMIASGIDGVMAAHIVFSAVDKHAVGFSQYWLQDVLRERLNFSGMVFSDDLSMEGAKVAGGFPERVDAALAAGCDMALVCNNRGSLTKTLDGLDQQKYFLSEEKISKLRGNFSLAQQPLKNSKAWEEKFAAFTEMMDTIS
jgi:beta-N-acetylhexosaminidase